MKILITGASGFIGRYVVAAALCKGYDVRAVVRSPQPTLPWPQHPQLEVTHLDLGDTARLPKTLEGINTVVHLAAVMSGTREQQRQGTVRATQALVAAMKTSAVQHLIAISSFSVYDYLALSPGTILGESLPLETRPDRRDGYTQAKLAQEILVRQFATETDTLLTILRPGIVYGKDHLWNASLGVNLKDRLWVCVGDRAILPLLYVEHCADAIVQAIQYPPKSRHTINLIDDDLPTQKAYREALRQVLPDLPPQLVLPWAIVNQISRWAARLPSILPANPPGLLVPARVHARFKPLAYSNTRAKQYLDWTPRFSLQEALSRSLSDIDLLQEAQS
ncbi:NAD-dependent epimerase/dehydratase family protein [Altericista sp. CCNU0014]|uniref:NAD-dependent epimerase/dehydratase family protein n=1 Tax=Altericista sp. CCNU0014 TaxID=3082949 RepID=UPI00384B2B70